MTAATPSEFAVGHTLALVERHLPAGARRVLEVGCGDGALASRLQARGLEVTAIDRSAEAVTRAQAHGVPAIAADFESFQERRFDALIFSRVLHHLDPLGRAVDHAAELVAPGGVVIAEEFAVERMDAETARWFYELTSLLEAAGLLPPDETEEPMSATQLERWFGHHVAHGPVHEGDDMLVALGRRFEIAHRSDPPYLYRYPCARLEASDRGLRVAHWIYDLEGLRIGERSLRAIGLRIVGRKGR